MDEYIERDAAINAVFEAYADGRSAYSALEAIPAVDVRPVVHGRWIVREINKHELSYGTTAYEPVYECSACGLPTESYLRYDEPIMPEDADFPRYCPNCGALMDKDGAGNV